jgi:WD40 repeat protein
MTSQTMPPSEGNSVTGTPLPIKHVFGEARFHADGDLAALSYAADGTLWSVEEPGLLRHWNPIGRPLERHFLSDLETLWVFGAGARLLASASDDLTLWDVASGKKLATIAQPSWVTTVAFSPDLKLIATGHDDGTVLLWDIASHQLVREIEAHEQPVSSLAFSPDGKRLASAGEDRLVLVWDTESGNKQLSLAGHTDRIPSLAWSPLGNRLVSAGWDTTARVWDATTGEPVILLNSHGDQVTLVTFSPDGKVLACADSENLIHLWNSTNWNTQHVLNQHEDEIRCLTFSPDNRLLVSGGGEQVIHLWDPLRGELISGSTSPSRHIISVGSASDGWRLASNGGGTSVHVWEPQSRVALLNEDMSGILAVASSPDGKWIAGGGADTRIRLWHGNGEPFLCLAGQRGPVAAMAISPHGELLASASASDGTVWVWNLQTGEPKILVLEAADGCTVETVAWHPEGNLLACGGIDWMATGGTDGAVCLWDIQKPAKLALFEFGTTSVAFHPSGRQLAAASLDEVVFLWDVQTQELLAELPGHKEGVSCLAYSPNGGWLASGSDDRTLRLWDADSRQMLCVHELDAPLQSLAFSPDSRFLFTGNGNTTCFQLEVAKLLEE